MKLTLGQAAKHAKRSKGTLSNALKNGNLSGDRVVKNGRDTWQIDPAELQRWMEYNPVQNRSSSQSTTPPESDEKHSETNDFAVRLEASEQRYEDLVRSSSEAASNAARTIQDLRDRLDAESEERRKLTAQLMDLREKPKGFWKRLFGS